MKVDKDTADLLFRSLFCLIFVGLGLEHIFSDALIQKLMPEWVPARRVISLGCGVWLTLWGSFILVGWKLHIAGIALALFLVPVTLLVHLPGIVLAPEQIPSGCLWIWDILQRTNLVKNLCLLGVCFHLLHHQVGRYSLEHYFRAGER